MKKIMLFIGIAITITLCGMIVLDEFCIKNNENGIKSFEKNKNSDNIQSKDKVVESNEAVFEVDYTEFCTEEAKFIVIFGYDKDGKIVWKYESEKTPPTENWSTEMLCQVEGRVYINDNFTIKALDNQTGKTIWECKNVECLNTSYYIDKESYLYLYSPVTDMFYEIDNDGKMLKEISMYELNGNSYEGLPTQSNGIDIMDREEINGIVGITIGYTRGEENEYGEYEEKYKMLFVSLFDYSVQIGEISDFYN